MDEAKSESVIGCGRKWPVCASGTLVVSGLGSGRSENHEMWFGLDEVDRSARISTDSLRGLGEEPPDARWTWRKDPPA
ncbi:hypothetical protein ACOKM3_06810 [Streptomyces sp. BH106]|uniref:hypothetical protein n=1 Tax=Streptomyces sp. BH106 TaxID=3410409 RepID=UPI003CF92E6D